MTAAEELIARAHSPQGWTVLNTTECLKIADEVDSLMNVLDILSVLFRKLEIYLPNDTYPSELVRQGLSTIDTHWKTHSLGEYV